jgi:UDP-2,3-diacylglucosamine pyrophosphatase LpxH
MGISKKIKLVVSDFHIGSGLYFRDGTRNILEDFQYDDAFISFLNYYSLGEYYEANVELIINGDFLNLLQINYKGVFTHLLTERIVLDGLRQSFQGHRALFEALKRFAKAPNHKISYVIGNHDQGMLFSKAQKLFSDYIEAQVTFYDHYYEFDGIRVEHGHQHEWNCRFDLKRYIVSRNLPEPVLNLPWGSRFVAEFLPKLKIERPYLDKVKPFKNMIRWILLNEPLWAIRAAFMCLNYFFKNLILRIGNQHFTLGGTLRLLFELNLSTGFENEAKKVLMSNPNIQTLIMGHTHLPLYRRYREGKEYYNIGTWNEVTDLSIGNLGTKVTFTFALIEYPEMPKGVDPTTIHDKSYFRPKVRLKEWKGVWSPVVDAAL